MPNEIHSVTATTYYRCQPTMHFIADNAAISLQSSDGGGDVRLPTVLDLDEKALIVRVAIKQLGI